MTHVEHENETGVATLLADILHDFRLLIVQQLTLFQVEIKNDIRRTLMAMIPLLAGAGTIVMAGFLLLFAAAFFLSWLIPDLPTWAGFAILGSAVGLGGLVLVLVGKSMLTSNNPLPEKAMEGLKENIQWKTKT